MNGCTSDSGKDIALMHVCVYIRVCRCLLHVWVTIRFLLAKSVAADSVDVGDGHVFILRQAAMHDHHSASASTSDTGGQR